MKKSVISALKKAGEKTAMLPINIRCYPGTIHQPKMPATLREKMNEQDKK